MRLAAILLLLTSLAACGRYGPPVRAEAAPALGSLPGPSEAAEERAEEPRESAP